MRLPEIEALCKEIVPGAGDLQINALGRGLINQAYRVTRDGRSFALRIAVADAEAIGLDRTWEARLLQTAGDAQLAPALRFSDAARGILLSDWLEGFTWERVKPADVARIGQVTRLLGRVHALPITPPAHRMSPPAWIQHYETSAAGGSLKHRSAAGERLEQWAALPAAPPVVCHGDLHALNLLQTGDCLRLLDWEYAHVSEAFWDLAGWCANSDFGRLAKRRLLGSYLGRPPSATEWRRLDLLAWLYDYVCLQWSALYLSRQPIGAAPGPTPAESAPAARIAARAAFLDARLSLPAN